MLDPPSLDPPQEPKNKRVDKAMTDKNFLRMFVPPAKILLFLQT
jgi:hypothetical protein